MPSSISRAAVCQRACDIAWVLLGWQRMWVGGQGCRLGTMCALCACQERYGRRCVDSALHACFECKGRHEELRQLGVHERPLAGASNVQQLFATGASTSRAVKFLDQLAQLVDG